MEAMLISTENERSYQEKFEQVILYINQIINPYGLLLSENSPTATTLIGYDDTYTVELKNTQGNVLGSCTVVIDDFSIDDDEPTTVLFVDYTSINVKGLGLSRIFVLFEVCFAILLEAPVVSNDVSGIPGRYSNYGFEQIDSDLIYQEDEDDEDDTTINNILKVDNLQYAKQILEQKIEFMFR